MWRVVEEMMEVREGYWRGGKEGRFPRAPAVALTGCDGEDTCKSNYYEDFDA